MGRHIERAMERLAATIERQHLALEVEREAADNAERRYVSFVRDIEAAIGWPAGSHSRGSVLAEVQRLTADPSPAGIRQQTLCEVATQYELMAGRPIADYPALYAVLRAMGWDGGCGQ